MPLAWTRLLCITTPRRLGCVLCLLGFFWAIIMMNLLLIGKQDDASSPDQLRVSKLYCLLNVFGWLGDVVVSVSDS